MKKMFKKIERVCLFYLGFASSVVYAQGQPLPPPTSNLGSGKESANLGVINQRVEDGFQNFFTMMRWFSLAVGIVVTYISLKNIADISNERKQGSILLNFMGILFGGCLTVISVILFMSAGVAERIATGKGI